MQLTENHGPSMFNHLHQVAVVGDVPNNIRHTPTLPWYWIGHSVPTGLKAGADAEPLIIVRNNNKCVMDMPMSKQQILADLKTRGFTPNQIKKCGYVIRDAKYTKAKTGFEVPSLEFQYKNQKGKIIKGASRFKLYWSEEEKQAWKKGKPPKYVSIKGEEPHLYYSNLLNKEYGSYVNLCKDISFPITITEGEFKTDVGCEYGFAVIGIAGVWSWKSKKKRLPVIPDLKEIVWDGREVYLTFDSDLKTNNKVQQALNALATWLTNQGAVVYIAFLPELPGQPNTGLDDFLHAKNDNGDSLAEIFEEAEEFQLCEELLKLNTEVGLVWNPGFIVEMESGLIMSRGDFVGQHYAPRTYHVMDGRGNMREKAAAPAWLKFPQRTTFKKLAYRPGDDTITSDLCYNVWRGWGVEPKRGSIKPWKDLLKRIFGNNEAEQKWFEQWLAYPLQNPGTKLAQAVIMVSREQGTGKSILGYTMGKIYGENYSEIGAELLTLPHNEWQQHKNFIVGNEIAGEDRRSYQNKIKNLVTQDETYINPKGIKGYTLDDCINYYLTSNHCNALYLEDADRRFFVWQFRADDTQAGKDERQTFFREVYAPWYLGSGPSHLFYYLLNLDLTGFDPKGPAPMTESKNEMIKDTKSDLGHWLIELKENPDEFLRNDGQPLKADLYTLSQLRALSGLGEKFTTTMWGKQLKERGFDKKKIRTSDVSTETIYIVRRRQFWDKQKPKKFAEHWCKHFPALVDKPKKY